MEVSALIAEARAIDARNGDADAAFLRAIDAADALVDDPDLLRAHARLAANVFLSRVNRYRDAVARIREAHEIVVAARGEAHAESADVLITLGYRLLEGRPYLPGTSLDEAEETLLRAIQLLPPDHPRLATAHEYLQACARWRAFKRR